jgi:hypothetical protein
MSTLTTTIRIVRTWARLSEFIVERSPTLPAFVDESPLVANCGRSDRSFQSHRTHGSGPRLG